MTNLSKEQITELVAAEVRKAQQPPPPRWEGMVARAAEHALELCYGDPSAAIDALMTEAEGDSDLRQDLGLSSIFTVPTRDELRPHAQRAIDQALAARGNKPWPQRPPAPDPVKPKTAEDYALEMLQRARANPQQPSNLNWFVPKYETVIPPRAGYVVNPGETRLAGMEPITVPEPSSEERAAHMLLRSCQTDSAIAATVFPGTQHHYLLGRSADMDRCRQLIDKVARQ